MAAKASPLQEDLIHHTEEAAIDDATVDVFEVSGSIKWFDASKGYGFIVPDDDLPDVLLHVTCLRRDGHQTAYDWIARHKTGIEHTLTALSEGRVDIPAPFDRMELTEED